MACQKDQVLTIPENEHPMLKGGEIVTEKVCLPSQYALVTKNNRQVGQITVSNDDNTLTVAFEEFGSSFSEVQLWVGPNPSMVPKNGQDIPLPGGFNYHGSGNATFSVSLYDLLPAPLPGGTFDGNDVFIFAHAEIEGSGPKGDDEISAWSEGTSFGTSRWGTYSTYITCCQPRGCFDYIAFGGNTFAEGVYYDNTENGGGSQDIRAGNGETAGTVQYASGTISFSFGPKWTFSGTQPELVIEGCNAPGGELTLLFTGMPSSNYGVYSVSVDQYPYYKIQYNLQYCN